MNTGLEHIATVRRAAFLSLSILLFASVYHAEAQQTGKVYKIGSLLGGFPSSAASVTEAFRQGMRDHGYVEGKHYVIEQRWVEGRREQLPAFAAELVKLNVDIIVAAATPPALAAQQATKTIPIVVAHMSDPVEPGLIANLARPGGNVTGMRSLQAELAAKRLELLKEAFPRISRVVALGSVTSGGSQRQLREMSRAAQALGIEIRPLVLNARDPDFQQLSRAIAEMRGDALTLLSSLGQLNYLSQIVDLQAKNRLPAIFQNSSFADAGGLMSYGIKYEHFHRRAAYFVDKILKGANPGDLPVEQTTNFELVVNLKTAKLLGLTIPTQTLMDADRVIK